jgi:hypothetical protein
MNVCGRSSKLAFALAGSTVKPRRDSAAARGLPSARAAELELPAYSLRASWFYGKPLNR